MSAILLPNGRVAAHGAAQPSLADPAATRRFAGLAVVLAVHALIGWALASGLAREVIEVIKKPIQTTLIPEVAPPPPPPPPKVVEKIKERPKPEVPPPPAYVPPPDIVPEVVPPAPVIQAVQAEPPKEPVVIAPPPPPAPEPKPVVKQEISLACPGYQVALEQTLGDAFERVGIAGAVRTRITVRGSQVVDAVPQSGPKEYYKYVQTAIKRMKCSAGGAEEVQVMLDVVFRK